MVSHARPDNVSNVASICAGFAIDNGAFTAWQQGRKPDWGKYSEFVQKWATCPSYDFCILPDVIGGTDAENDALIEKHSHLPHSVPVWHLHESLARLEQLAKAFPMIALGSSGAYAKIGTPQWWSRIDDALMLICDPDGRPITRIHRLRMLDRKLRSIPFYSADSTGLARNLSHPTLSKKAMAVMRADHIEGLPGALSWAGMPAIEKMPMDLFELMGI